MKSLSDWWYRSFLIGAGCVLIAMGMLVAIWRHRVSDNRPNPFVTGYNFSAMKKSMLRGLIEVGFIIFLFYSNLLMGEFERSGMGQKKGLAWALSDIFTNANFQIAAVASLIGYVLVEFLRARF